MFLLLEDEYVHLSMSTGGLNTYNVKKNCPASYYWCLEAVFYIQGLFGKENTLAVQLTAH